SADWLVETMPPPAAIAPNACATGSWPLTTRKVSTAQLARNRFILSGRRRVCGGYGREIIDRPVASRRELMAMIQQAIIVSSHAPAQRDVRPAKDRFNTRRGGDGVALDRVLNDFRRRRPGTGPGRRLRRSVERGCVSDYGCRRCLNICSMRSILGCLCCCQ